MRTLLALLSACASQPSRPAARAAESGPTDLASVALTPIAEGVWMHRSLTRTPDDQLSATNGLVLAHGAEAALIDSAATDAQTLALYDELKAAGLTVRAAIFTHAATDGNTGISVLARDHGVVCYRLLRPQFDAECRGLPASEPTLPDAGALTFSDTRVEYFYPGPSHAYEDIVIYLPAQRLLLGGGLVRALKSDLGSLAGADLSGWRKAILQIRRRFPDIARIVPGHGEPGGPELLTHTLTMVHAAITEVHQPFGGG